MKTRKTTSGSVLLDVVVGLLTLFVIITGVLLVLAWFTPAHADPINPVRTEYVKCHDDTSRDCVWDLNHMGEGDGFSFSFYVGEGGHVYRLPHHIAHHLMYHH